FTNGKYVFQKKVNGKLRTFHVTRISVKNQHINYIGDYKTSKGWKIVQPSIAYTKEEAESFVNTLGVSSKTKHLIWVNQYTQRLCVFTGKKGKWKLIKQCEADEVDGYPGWPVASGKPTSPTSTGKTSIKQRDLGGGGKVPFWNVTSWFSIHGNSEGPWGPLGWPKSGACTRNRTSNAKWIYYKTKMHTAVYVY
ncbi:MAG: L,D-transpeptidase, partial [Oscillospiraceae bacterium]|nr:L,D-transpeptidase [Oscillospiraceae bacterium]